MKIFYVIKLKNGYIQYTEHYPEGTQYGVVPDIAYAKIYSTDPEKKNQTVRLRKIAKNIGYMPKAIEVRREIIEVFIENKKEAGQ